MAIKTKTVYQCDCCGIERADKSSEKCKNSNIYVEIKPEIKSIDEHEWFDDDVSSIEICKPGNNGYGDLTEEVAVIYNNCDYDRVLQSKDDLRVILSAMGYDMVKRKT